MDKGHCRDQCDSLCAGLRACIPLWQLAWCPLPRVCGSDGAIDPGLQSPRAVQLTPCQGLLPASCALHHLLLLRLRRRHRRRRLHPHPFISVRSGWAEAHPQPCVHQGKPANVWQNCRGALCHCSCCTLRGAGAARATHTCTKAPSQARASALPCGRWVPRAART